MIFFFFTLEIQEWKGAYLCFRNLFMNNGDYKWFDEEDCLQANHFVGQELPPAQTFYRAPRPTEYPPRIAFRTMS